LEKVKKTSSKMIFFTFYDFFPRKRTQPCQQFKIVGSDTNIKEVENFVFNCGILGSRSKAFWKCCIVSGSVYNQSATFGGGKKDEGMRMRNNTVKKLIPKYELIAKLDYYYLALEPPETPGWIACCRSQNHLAHGTTHRRRRNRDSPPNGRRLRRRDTAGGGAGGHAGDGGKAAGVGGGSGGPAGAVAVHAGGDGGGGAGRCCGLPRGDWSRRSRSRERPGRRGVPVVGRRGDPGAGDMQERVGLRRRKETC
jgi:hypothetical protein